MKIKTIIALILLSLFCFSCEQKDETNLPGMKRIDTRKPMAWGHRQTVYAVADNQIWKYAESPLRKTLERYQFTTVNEQFFEVKRADFKALDQFYKYNNLIFYCDLQSKSPVSEHVKSVMTDAIKKQVEEDGIGMFPVENLWANDQYVLFLIGSSEENLLKLNILQANEIFQLFREKLISRIKQKIYQQKVYSEKQFAAFPWSMKIPQKYVVFREGERFISFLSRLRKHPDKFIAIYYEDMEENKIDKEWLMQKRLAIFANYYEGDTFKKEDIRSEFVQFNSYSGVKISGRWQNEETVTGGAFQSYAFYDESKKQAFLVDNTVYFPQGDKLEALLELEVISKTFELKE